MILKVVHHHPGRLRLRSEAFEDGGEAQARAVRALRDTGGVLDVHASARTGSLLAAYDPERVGPDALADAVARAAGLERAEPAHPGDEEQPIDAVIDAARGLNAAVSELAHHRADLRVIVPAVLAGAGVYAFFAGKEPRLPRWDTLLYWAYAVFEDVNRREIEKKTHA